MTERWSPERANAWHAEQPWLVGCNYVPSNAINQLEMWRAESFDPEANDRELGWAAGLGMNTVRVYLHDHLWRDDAAGFRGRIERFLDIAHGHAIRPMFVIFDDCWYEPELGVPEPRPGLHNSGWLRSPGRRALEDRGEWGRLEDYVRGLIDAFGRDERVLAWDVYNEVRNEYLPIMSKPQPQRGVAMAETAARQRLGRRHADELLEAAFGWARAEAPTQPLTAGVYYPFEDLNEKLTSLSDVISFHCYTTVAELEEQVAELKKHDRPLMCTEWLSRQTESTPERFLPVFERQKIGCYNWGLVDGKTQTKFSWQDRPAENGSFTEPDPWFHDLLRADGAPYREGEAALFRELTGRGGACPRPGGGPRMSTAFELDPSYEVGEAQVEAFWRDGHVVLPSVLSEDEMATCREAIRAQAEADFGAAGQDALTFGGAFFQTLNMRTRSEAVARFVLSPRLGRIAASLLRVPAVRVYHDQALFKPPGGIASYWHQDQYFWPLETDRSLGLWMPLTDVTEQMGTMRYASGSHQLSDLGQHTIDAASERHFDALIEADGLKVTGTGAMRAGDCAFHLGWTVHGALANRSDRLREAMVVTFYPDGTRVGEITNDHRASDAEKFLGGGRPGQPAAGPHNTRVWPQVPDPALGRSTAS